MSGYVKGPRFRIEPLRSQMVFPQPFPIQFEVFWTEAGARFRWSNCAGLGYWNRMGAG
jgi:hypothetical protein